MVLTDVLAPLQVAWTPRNTILYPAICSLAGLVAGMFGVGGGIVKVRQGSLMTFLIQPCVAQELSFYIHSSLCLEHHTAQQMIDASQCSD